MPAPAGATTFTVPTSLTTVNWNFEGSYYYIDVSGPVMRWTFDLSSIPAGYIVYQARSVKLSGNGVGVTSYAQILNNGALFGQAVVPPGAGWNGTFNDINYSADTGISDLPVPMPRTACSIVHQQYSAGGAYAYTSTTVGTAQVVAAPKQGSQMLL